LQELNFLSEALEEVIKCRKVLKWTYVFGYYIENGKEKNLFEFLQEKLEENCDKLHELIEAPFDKFLDTEITDKKEFYHYKGDLINFYKITQQVRKCVMLVL
jgi:ariadne-1